MVGGRWWCGESASPFVSGTICSQTAAGTEPCRKKVATEKSHCEDSAYNPNVPAPEKVETEEPTSEEEMPSPAISIDVVDAGPSPKVMRQLFLQTDQKNPSFYLLTSHYEIKTRDSLLAAAFACSVAGVVTELLRFLKQYVSIKRRISGNSLETFSHNLLGNAESDQNKDEFELSIWEKLLILLFFVLHRTMEVILAAQVMMSYNLWIILAISGGLAFGNLLFGGLLQD